MTTPPPVPRRSLRDAVLDTSVLRRLAANLDNAAFTADLAARYRGLLEQRVHRITVALAAADAAAAMETVLSLKVSSITVGASELAQLAADLEGDLRRDELATARLRATALPRAAARADRALAAYLLDA